MYAAYRSNIHSDVSSGSVEKAYRCLATRPGGGDDVSSGYSEQAILVSYTSSGWYVLNVVYTGYMYVHGDVLSIFLWLCYKG